MCYLSAICNITGVKWKKRHLSTISAVRTSVNVFATTRENELLKNLNSYFSGVQVVCCFDATVKLKS